MLELFSTRRFFLVAGAALCAATIAHAQQPAAPLVWDWDAAPEPLALVGASVFDGRGFRARPVFVKNGVIVAERPTNAREIRVDGAYITPAFADAHVHRFSSASDAEESRAFYLSAGVMFVMNWGSSKHARAECAPVTNRPAGVDVLYANGGFTAPGGHPIKWQETLHLRHGGDAATFLEEASDDRFYVVRSAADAAEKAALHAATRPDLLKLFLLHSEEHALRRDDKNFYGDKGLDPALVGPLVRAGRERGLRVGAHVESAADFRVAVGAGVDFVLHTPGYNIGADDVSERFTLTATDAARAAERGAAHVTTVSWVRTRAALETVRRNLGELRDAGVPILFGSDDYANGPVMEMRVLRALGTFSNLELLNMLCRDTPRRVFPNRKLGAVEPGFEASLLVFPADPLSDFGVVVRGPRGVIKGGAVLAMSPEVAGGA